jgi:hypothetical protein
MTGYQPGMSVRRPATAAAYSRRGRSVYAPNNETASKKPDEKLAPLAKLIEIQMYQSSLHTELIELARNYKSSKADINNLLDNIDLKADKKIMEKHLEVKASTAYVDSLFERALKHLDDGLASRTLPKDEIIGLLKKKSNVSTVESLKGDLDLLKRTMRIQIKDSLIDLTMGVRDQVKNVATKTALKKGLRGKVDMEQLEKLAQQIKTIARHVGIDVEDMNGSFNNQSFEEKHGLVPQHNHFLDSRSSVAERFVKSEEEVAQLKETMRELRSLFEINADSTRQQLERFEKERQDNGEVLRAHVGLRVSIDKVAKDQLATETTLTAIQDQIRTIMNMLEERNKRDAEEREHQRKEVQFLKREIAVMKFRLRDSMDHIHTRVDDYAEKQPLPTTHRKWLRPHSLVHAHNQKKKEKINSAPHHKDHSHHDDMFEIAMNLLPSERRLRRHGPYDTDRDHEEEISKLFQRKAKA